MRPSCICTLVVVISLAAPGSAFAADRLEDAIPDDAWAALHVERASRALPPTLLRPIVDALADDPKARDAMFNVVQSIPGPFLLGLLPPPEGENDPTIFLVMDLPNGSRDPDELVEKSILPAIRLLGGPTPIELKLERDGAIRHVRHARSKSTFAYTVKDARLVGATDPTIPLRWSRGQWPEKRWVEQPGVKKMIGALPRDPAARILVNATGLTRLIPKPKRNSAEELALTVLAPEDVQAAAIDFSWEPYAISTRAHLALVAEPQGLAKVLAQPGGSPTLLGAFPPDFVALGRVGWTSLGGLVDGAYTLCDRFDPAISAEFRAELAEFKKESGVDFHADILSNLGEAAFGVRVDFARKNPIGWATVFPLRDDAAFSAALDKLIAHFDLTFTDKSVAGIPTRLATQTYPFALAIHERRLILASDPETAADVAAQIGKGSSEPTGANLKDCLAALTAPQSFCTLVDLELLFKKVPLIAMAIGPDLAGLFGRGTVGLALSGSDQLVKLELRWSMLGAGQRRPAKKPDETAADDAEGMEALAALAGMMAESISQARRQAKQSVSMSQMRGLGQTLHIYAQEHKGEFPKSLVDAIKDLPEKESYLAMLTSPYDGRGPKTISEIDRQSYVLYRPGLTAGSDPGEIVLAERAVGDRDGAGFLFVDGHVEFIPEPRASELIQLIEQGADSVKP